MIKLAELLKNLDYLEIYGKKDIGLRSVVDFSNNVGEGDLFVSIVGAHFNPNVHIPEIIKGGARVIVSEVKPKRQWLERIVFIRVKDARKALAQLASAYYGNPSKKLKVIGITGTDGKTTTSSILAHILNSCGVKTGLVTTVSAKIGKKEYDTGLHVTNPEPLDLQKFLRIMVDRGCTHAVLEVTSHGIDQKRIEGIDFDIAVLTNITKEHLDYHKTFKKYFLTKVGFLKRAKTIVVNANDKHFSKIKKLLGNKNKLIPYSPNTLDHDLNKCIVDKFPQKYNQANASAAVVVAKLVGVKNEDICDALETFKGVEGRLQKVGNNRGVDIYVDFAHTPKAVDSVLSFLGKDKKGKLISVVSAEGERDKQKRIVIPRAAIKYSDLTVLNPIDTRSEEPENILGEMLKAARESSAKEIRTASKLNDIVDDKYFIGFTDRRKAISYAIKFAKKGDTVVICGKGHEKSMNIDGVEKRWSDLKVVKEVLK